MLIWAAIPAYLVAIVLCARAALFVGSANGLRADTRTWWTIAALFLAMTVNRMFAVEETLLQTLRPLAIDQSEYAQRADYQAPLAAAIAVLVGAAVLILVRPGRGERPPQIARALLLGRLAAVGMIGLVALRVLSFHATDALLYGGPHINRVFDPGLALAAAYAGWLFVRAVRYRAKAAR